MEPRSIGAKRKAKSSDHQSGLFQLEESRVQLGEWPAVARGISFFSEGGGVLGALTKGWRGTASGAQTREVCQLSSGSGIY